MEVGYIGDWNSLSPVEQIQRTVQANNSWSAEQAQRQMDFQREMSNTAHQREIADLKAAGLNPVLSAKLGGASTPSGAMGTTDTSATSALIDLLALSMQTANSAAGAAYAAADDGDGFNLFGTHIDLSRYRIKNADTPAEIAYNFGLDWLNENMPDIDGAIVTAAVSALWKKVIKQEEEQKLMPHHGRSEFINDGVKAAKEVVRTFKERPSYYDEGAGQSAKSRSFGSGKTSSKGIAALTGLAGGIGMLGGGLGNRRYGSHPQLQF